MINNVSSTSKHIYTSGGSSLPYVSYNPTNPAQGDIRINGSEMETFDGNQWIKIISGTASVGMSYEAEEALDWAIKKKKQEEEWYKLASTNEAVRTALDQLEQARTRLELITILSKDHEKTTS